MKLSVVSAVCLTVWYLSAIQVLSQRTTVSDDAASVSSGLSSFALELLAKTAVEGGDQLNVVTSTYSIWNLLAILNEGANGATANQLRAALRIPPNNNVFRVGYKAIGSALMRNTAGVDINVANAIFADRNKQISKSFQSQTSSQFRVNFFPVNFQDRAVTANFIDSIIRNATAGRIKNFINFDDLVNAELILTSAIFFKGMWTLPFNTSSTFTAPFYSENERQIGTVSMMNQTASFAYTYLESLQANALELPYGSEEKYSMIVILPQQGVLLSNLLTRLSTIPFQSVIDSLEESKEMYEGDETQVFLPKFKITSDFVLNVILEKMGIVDVFDPYYANLLKIADENFYLSRVIHKAEIEVTEEGTVASAATGGVLNYKNPRPIFLANRPFAFFIVEKSTNTMLFAGKISNPNEL